MALETRALPRFHCGERGVAWKGDCTGQSSRRHRQIGFDPACSCILVHSLASLSSVAHPPNDHTATVPLGLIAIGRSAGWVSLFDRLFGHDKGNREIGIVWILNQYGCGHDLFGFLVAPKDVIGNDAETISCLSRIHLSIGRCQHNRFIGANLQFAFRNEVVLRFLSPKVERERTASAIKTATPMMIDSVFMLLLVEYCRRVWAVGKGVLEVVPTNSITLHQ